MESYEAHEAVAEITQAALTAAGIEWELVGQSDGLYSTNNSYYYELVVGYDEDGFADEWIELRTSDHPGRVGARSALDGFSVEWDANDLRTFEIDLAWVIDGIKAGHHNYTQLRSAK